MLLIILVQGFCPLRLKHGDWLVNNQNINEPSGATTHAQS